MIKILKESMKGLVVPKCHAWSSFVAELFFSVLEMGSVDPKVLAMFV